MANLNAVVRLTSELSRRRISLCTCRRVAADVRRRILSSRFVRLLTSAATVHGLLACLGGAFFVHSADYDSVVRHGRIIDGMGSPAYFADVAIKSGKIAAIGKALPGTSAEEIDATGFVVAPGFIDVHTHAEDIRELPLAENFVRMGVTTVIAGNCGSSVRNVAELWRAIETNHVSVNVATLIGHGTIRSLAMGGSFNRAPSQDELAKMEALVDQAMKGGAVGISTGLIYLPGVFSKTDELIDLAKVAARYDGIYASHIRDEGLGISSALDEVFRIARKGGLRAHISHIKLSGRAAWGKAAEILASIERARADGLDITQDEYVYTASSTGLSQLIPEEAREGGLDAFKKRLSDRSEKQQIVDRMKARLRRNNYDDYAYAVIAHHPHDPSLDGLNVVEAARTKHGTTSLDDQIEVILDIHSQGGASAVFHGINEDDLREFARHPNTMFASDSGVRRFGEGVPHPRGYGNNARVLARYVRDLKIMRLEEAIRRMTSLPALTFHLKDRGRLQEGAWADLVIFDPSVIQDKATFTQPHQYPVGIRHVFVNGVAVVRDEMPTGARPGLAVRRNSF